MAFGKHLAVLSLVWGPGLAQGSALVVKNEREGILEFHTRLLYSGEAASQQVAYEASAEIARLWNEPRSMILYGYRYYRVQFHLSFGFKNPLEDDSGSCGENRIIVERGDPHTKRSFYRLGGRSGTFYLSDGLGVSTTTAHEYGHGLGLGHDDTDQLSAPIPGIMFPRGTYVQPRFQWNPGSEPGAPGGSLNPRYRKVRLLDVMRLDLARLNFQGGIACMGEGLPIPVFSPNPLPLHPMPSPRTGLEREEIQFPDVRMERFLDEFDH